MMMMNRKKLENMLINQLIFNLNYDFSTEKYNVIVCIRVGIESVIYANQLIHCKIEFLYFPYYNMIKR